MATLHPASLTQSREAHTLSALRLATAGGITAAVLFLLCWLGTFLPFSSPTHAYITLLTNAEMSSGLALVEGLCWSLLFGLLSGAVFALVYNATASLGHR